MHLSMVGQYVLVAGGTGGIGRATVTGLAALGARIGITRRDQGRAADRKTKTHRRGWSKETYGRYWRRIEIPEAERWRPPAASGWTRGGLLITGGSASGTFRYGRRRLTRDRPAGQPHGRGVAAAASASKR